ncbi:hypothetical protein D3C87_1390680 [compost metagenome]
MGALGDRPLKGPVARAGIPQLHKLLFDGTETLGRRTEGLGRCFVGLDGRRASSLLLEHGVALGGEGLALRVAPRLGLGLDQTFSGRSDGAGEGLALGRSGRARGILLGEGGEGLLVLGERGLGLVVLQAHAVERGDLLARIARHFPAPAQVLDLGAQGLGLGLALRDDLLVISLG